jgi:hypothetical protein
VTREMDTPLQLGRSKLIDQRKSVERPMVEENRTPRGLVRE